MISVPKLLHIISDVEVFLTTTLGVLELLREEKVQLRSPYSCLQHDDEELCLVWTNNPDIRLDIGFPGTGYYSYWGKNLRTGEEFTGDEVFVHHMLPDQLLELLIEKRTTP
jgi:hypothetical protein